MKKILFLMIAAGGTLSAVAQVSNTNNHADSLLSRWVIDFNLLGGGVNQAFTTANSNANYLNALNMNTGKLSYKDGYSFGGDAQLGYFFGKKRHFGLGTGILYMQQYGDAALDNYHVEYQATDGGGHIYRQVVTGNNIKETINSSNLNIPIVLKYKNRFSKHWGFTADAGVLINLQMNNAYTTDASFNYEAIYKFSGSNDGGPISVYDNSPTPSANDWLITKAEFLRNNPNGNYQDYVNAKRALGYNVGEGLTPNSRTGNVSYTPGSLGFIIQPSLNYFLSDKTALNFGVYYIYQSFKNNAQKNYTLTDGIGTYSSVLNNATASINQAYGLNVGVRFFLGRKHEPMTISSIDNNSPSQCGLSDGSIALHGLSPNQPVTVNYSLNGVQAAPYSAIVQPDGQVKIAHLSAGNYTGIVATIKKKSVVTETVTLADPAINISSQNTTDPTLSGTCNGSVTLNGLYSGSFVTINYNLNGSSQVPFTGIVNANNSIAIHGLCEGNYTGVVVTFKNCTANGKDFVLSAPAPAPTPTPPPPVPVAIIEKADLSTTILFDFDKSVIKSSYYAVLDEAYKEVEEDNNVFITVGGYTDKIGSKAYNKKLSERRARAVKRYLTNKGVSSNRVKIHGYGKTHPTATNETSEGRSQNRRAMVDITPTTSVKPLLEAAE